MMNETNMALVTDWFGADLSGWLVSEKFHGCRAMWDGAALWTRGGKRVKAPDWFTAGLPAHAMLDGEIWAGYDDFEVARLATQYGKFTPAVRFLVFDRPDAPGNWLARMAAVQDCGAFASPVPIIPAASMADVHTALSAVKARGGEGLVLRNPAAVKYEPGRSTNIVRIK